MRRDVLMPRLSEEVEEAVVVAWFVEPGDVIKAGDLMAELQVEKLSSEFHAPFGGRVAQLLVQPGGVIVQGGPIAVVEELDAPAAVAATPPPASPAARRLARELGVDINAVHGSGPGGRVVEADVQAAAHRAGGNGEVATARPQPRIEPLTPMRRAIAERLSTWLGETAQLTLFAEADVTAFAEAQGEQPSYLAAALKALAIALDDHPAAAARWTAAGLAHSDRHDIGVAIAVPGGLVTPVVRDVERKDLAQLSGEIAQLAERARAGSLAPPDVEGAVLSVTNLGAHRVDGFTPLLNPPQAMILGMGRARWRPAVVDGSIQPRLLMTLSLTFDHRVIDGAPAAAFLTEVVELLEAPARLM